MFDTPALKKLFSAFPKAAENLRFVGGCVRDSVLGLDCVDIDLCTTYTPQEVIEYLTAADIKYVPTGIEHGTVMAVIDGQGYEITTLRHDLETDGRHATVTFTTSFAEDASRRDFTINALSRDWSGKIYDYWQGLDDLKAGHIRFIGNPQDRIQEDYLRILRYFRFYARFSKQAPDSDTLHAISTFANKLHDISGERIQSEVFRLLKTKDIIDTLNMMESCHVFQPSLDVSLDLDIMEKWLSFEDKFGLASHAQSRLLALIAGDGIALTALAKRIKLSRKDLSFMDTVRQVALSFSAEPLKIHLYDHGIEVTRAAYGLSQILARAEPSLLVMNQIDAYVHTPFPITGQDLIAEGIKPGPELGQELRRRERAWILGEDAP